jgi:hypothetical protein
MAGQEHEPSREQGGLKEPALAVQLVYEPNPKHKPIRIPGWHGSICPRDANGQALLRSSNLLGKKRYATHDPPSFEVRNDLLYDVAGLIDLLIELLLPIQ